MEFAHPPSSLRPGVQRASLLDYRHGDDLQISDRVTSGKFEHATHSPATGVNEASGRTSLPSTIGSGAQAHTHVAQTTGMPAAIGGTGATSPIWVGSPLTQAAVL